MYIKPLQTHNAVWGRVGGGKCFRGNGRRECMQPHDFVCVCLAGDARVDGVRKSRLMGRGCSENVQHKNGVLSFSGGKSIMTETLDNREFKPVIRFDSRYLWGE